MTNVNTEHHWEPSLTFCLIDVCICVRMSAVISVVSPGYGHLRVPIIELILQVNICIGLSSLFPWIISPSHLDTVSKSCMRSAMS